MGRGCGGCPAFVGCWQLRHGGSGAIAARCCTLPQHATDGGCVHPSFLCSVKLIFILTASSFLNNLELSIFTNGSCAYHLYPFETNKKKNPKKRNCGGKSSWCALHVFEEASARDSSIVVH